MQDTRIPIEQLMSQPENISFAFQPVFVARTNEIYGYEALMRPFPYSPMEVITEFAKLNRLNYIEEITTYYGAKQFLENKLTGKLFLNSFPAAVVSDEILIKIRELVKGQLKNRLVIEILEYTQFNSHAFHQKVIQFKKSKTGQEVAIDDYGSGKNIDMECIDFYKPDIVKIDHSLIKDIHINKENQHRLNEICSVLTQKNISLLAECIETKEEYDYLKKCPIKLMQGYYLGKPEIYSKK